MKLLHNRFAAVLFATTILAIISTSVEGQLTPLAHYRLGEEDAGAAPGSRVTSTVDDIAFGGLQRNMSAVGTVNYSDDTPGVSQSQLSTTFVNGRLATNATPWHNLYSGFRVGMEAWLKIDEDLIGETFVPFGNGSGYRLEVGSDGFYRARSGGSTPPSVAPVRYGEWQHVAFWTTGSFWQVYVDGEGQFDPNDVNFNYGSPSGEATIGTTEYRGLIDEHRVFTWTGAFDPGELLFFTQRLAGDVNENGVVNDEDYDIWRMNVGADLTELSLLEGRGLGDVNTDRAINLDDFAIIKANAVDGAQFAIPEPASCLLLATGIMALLATRRRRRA